jgi:hypothetical protein
VAFADGVPDMVAILLLKLIETPVGSPVALAVKVSVHVVLKV